ncbi:MAG TPA: hypothetical protein VFK21_12060 [Gammaproteobacteria bacterium]|nr:hypothetical protein [Gammaproteobacteria bacterium]
MNLRKVYRITTFVPPEHLEALLEGIASEVPLRYGRYDRAAWWSAVGVEQFRPLPGAKPTAGTIGTIERVPTVRVEFAIPRDPAQLERLITKGLRSHHPWQEPAVFVDETEIAVSDDAAALSGI